MTIQPSIDRMRGFMRAQSNSPLDAGTLYNSHRPRPGISNGIAIVWPAGREPVLRRESLSHPSR